MKNAIEELIEILQGVKAGKDVEYLSVEWWPVLPIHNLLHLAEIYKLRLKPMPKPKKRVPLEASDIKIGSAIRGHWRSGEWQIITFVSVEGITTINSGELVWSILMGSCYEITFDSGKTWLPCSKEVEV